MAFIHPSYIEEALISGLHTLDSYPVFTLNIIVVRFSTSQ